MPELPVTVADGTGSGETELTASKIIDLKRGWLILDEPGGARVELPGRGEPDLTIGRDPVCTVQVPFDDDHVSRRHARLGWFSPGWWSVTDLCSSNGTFVEAERVHDPIPITAGQFLQVGQTVYRIEFEDEA
jgi:pSer/pThr/pTyr-binding forkhead associated (FHA) protein